MSGAKSKLICLVWPDDKPDEHIVPVKIDDDDIVADLKKLIKDEHAPMLDKVAARDLVLWKCSGLPDDDNLEQTLKTIRFDGSDVRLVHLNKARQRISQLFGDEDLSKEPIHILVEVPAFKNARDRVSTFPDTIFLKFTAPARGVFGKEDNVLRNKIFESHAEPDKLRDFRAMLRQSRWTKSNMARFSLINDPGTTAIMERSYEINDDLEESDNSGRLASSDELSHVFGAYKLKNCFRDKIKEGDVRWIFGQLALYFESLVGEKKCGFCTAWPFQLLAEVSVAWMTSAPVELKKEIKTYSYTPQSDFSLFFQNELYLMVEVQSDKDQADRHRMLLQAACATRMRNALHHDEHNVPLIVTAIYITSDAKLDRYFLFQSSDKSEEIHYVKHVFDLKQPQERFTAVFEMYNLASVIQRDMKFLKNVRQHITDIGKHIGREFGDKFMSTRGSTTDADMRSKKSRTGQSGGSGGNHLYNARHVSEAFTHAGFTLERTSSSDGWTPLNELRSTMRYGKHSDGTAVIVKLLRPRCNELSILEYLSSIDSPTNHTIPLLRSFRLDVGTFIVVPEFTRLDIGLQNRQFPGKIASLGNQLIEGVGFMHCNGVAHLDIKPQNIVVRSDDRLFIIDFDLSLRVDGPDHLIDRWCGTPEWMAPEIGERDGPRLLYSPIMADLWSCGHVLSFLIAKSKEVVGLGELITLTKLLLRQDPRYRPSLPVRQQAKRKADTLESPRGTKQLAL